MIIVGAIVLPLVIAGILSLTSCKTPHSVTVTWHPAQAGAAPIEGYNVYRGMKPGGPYEIVARRIPATIYTDSAVKSGQTYYYVVAAVDQSGLESPHSEEISSKDP
jgi:fibronectin type 3 domain-containing protein